MHLNGPGTHAEPGTFFRDKDSTWQIQQATRNKFYSVYRHLNIIQVSFLWTFKLQRKGDVVISTKIEFYILPSWHFSSKK